MKDSYRVAQVSKPGTLEIAERKMLSPGAGEVLISVEACGVCGADAGDIDRADPAMRPARVPGHESSAASQPLVPERRRSGKLASGLALEGSAGPVMNAPSAVAANSSSARTNRSSARPAMAVTPK